jgi:hypothetical protein
MLPFAAIRAVARAELRRRWRSLLVLGLVAGVVGAVVTSSVALARRTATAHERLQEAVHVEDARVQLFGSVNADDVAALPGVSDSWEASLYVGKVDGPGVNYLGLVSGPSPPPDLFTPVVVEGRSFAVDDAHEAVIVEQQSAPIGLRVGDEVAIKLLTPEEVGMFDTGFGEPDGPRVTLEIVGVVRTSGSLDGSPLIASPAFRDEYADMTAATSMFVRLDDDPAARREFAAGITALNEQAEPIPGAEEFPSVTVLDPSENSVLVQNTARVLVGGLAVFAIVAAAVGLLVLAQVFARHHATGSADQQVEAALGLTSGERVLARVLPAALPALVAAAVTVAGAVASGRLEPWGAMRRVEPAPGFAPHVPLALLGGAVAAVAVLGLSAATARRAGRPSTWVPSRPSRAAGKIRALVARPSVVVGTGLALAGARGRSAPTRSSLIGTAIGVAGLVAAFTFAASLDRIEDEPARYGFAGDLTVVDVNEEIVDELLADERLAAVTVIDSLSVEIDGQSLQGYAFDNRRGVQDWWILDGRTVSDEGEIVLGSRIARRMDREVGDTVVASTVAGDDVELRVVGIGVGPSLNGERLGENLLTTKAQIDEIGVTAPFLEAMVRVGPGVDDEAVFADLAPRYETFPDQRPTEVENLIGLGRLPHALGIFLGAIAVMALVHALVVTTIRRAGDLALVRALGVSRRQVTRSIAVMAVTVSAAGLVAGIPVGYAIGRLVWWAVANSVGIGTDAVFPAATVALIVPLVVTLAVIVAWLPARRAGRSSPAAALRAE